VGFRGYKKRLRHDIEKGACARWGMRRDKRAREGTEEERDEMAFSWRNGRKRCGKS
jgi:hypothetical protein